MNWWNWYLTDQLTVNEIFSVLRQWVRHCWSLESSHDDCGAVFSVDLWMNMGVTGFTRKTGVFFTYDMNGSEFPPALYQQTLSELKSVKYLHEQQWH